jgi:hypothetical protein
MAPNMPTPDLPPSHGGHVRIGGRFRVHFGPSPGPTRKPPRRKGDEPEREPVEPRPKNLSGGGAAALEFDD